MASSRYTKKKVLINFTLLFIVFLLIHTPKLFADLPPYTFCDEDIFVREIEKMLEAKQWITSEFKSGALNIYPSLVFLKLLSVFDSSISMGTVYLVARFIQTFIPLFFTGIVLFFLTRAVFENDDVAAMSSWLFILSPTTYALTRYAYPDNSIFFVTAIYALALVLFIKKPTKIFFLTLAGISFSFALSYKLTAFVLFFMLPLGLLNIYKSKNVTQKRFFLFSIKIIAYFFTVVILFYATLNFSIFFNFDLFLEHQNFNRLNYANHNGSKVSGVLFYLTSIFVLPFGFIFAALFLSSLIFKQQKTGNFKLILFSPIAFFVIFFGSQGLVLHRNIAAVLILVFPLVAWGIYSSLNWCHNLNSKKIRKISYSIACLGGLFFLLPTIYSFKNDTLVDSRVLAHEWLKENFDQHLIVGMNEECTGETPANGTSLEAIKDPFMESKLSIYVMNSYGSGTLAEAYHRNKGLLQIIDQKYVMLHSFNYRELYKSKSDIKNVYELIPADYEILKEFKGKGPEIIILYKKL